MASPCSIAPVAPGPSRASLLLSALQFVGHRLSSKQLVLYTWCWRARSMQHQTQQCWALHLWGTAGGAAGKDLIVYKADDKLYCSDAMSTAYEFPLIDAKVTAGAQGPELEVPLDGTRYKLDSGVHPLPLRACGSDLMDAAYYIVFMVVSLCVLCTSGLCCMRPQAGGSCSACRTCVGNNVLRAEIEYSACIRSMH